ncbi:hypothetical protein K492DRAFT_81575 [Lichtheimia hyalospora FSU 10163]|nr:hypothetical protein K492DRAFT_81575 [Lichtheimia hyalospora FSU 10163]
MPTAPGSNKESIEERNEITLTSGDDLKKQYSHHSSDLEKNVPSDFAGTLKKSDAVDDQEDPATYPGLVECAPFPTLGSVNEITQTLSKTQTNRTARGISKDDESIRDEENEGISPAIGEAYHTEGWRNPGWLTVLATFLVNFSVFGTVFSWGNYQKLYVSFKFIQHCMTEMLMISFLIAI